jgi:D-3-phosphoglycerate dehydrogenase / 2-oxoglutarate reductase
MKNPSYQILFSAPYMLPFGDRFKPVFDKFGIELIKPEVHERLSEKEILAYAGQFDGTICGDDKYSEKVIKACLPRLKVISKWGTGIDSIDKQAAMRLGVKIGNTSNAFTIPVADSVLGYMLLFARKLLWMDRAMKKGIWEKIPGVSLSECTLGVIGVGNVGKAVLRRAHAFGMKLLGNDIIPIDPSFLHEITVEMVSLEELLKRSDFVSINADLNPSSRHLINADVLSKMKKSAYLINTARGPIIEEKALILALKAGKLAGVAMDVFEDEPLPSDSPLRSMDTVFLAAHNANSSPVAWENVHWNTIRNLLMGLGIENPDLSEFQGKI